MDDPTFQAQLNKAGNYEHRRAVERLREGLFDPLSIRLLTTGQKKLDTVFEKGLDALAENNQSHLCICGAYGQGKSHSLKYLQQKTLKKNFVVSYINLDPRQVPFHNFHEVYKALMKNMKFPDEETCFIDVWKTFAKDWLASQQDNKKKDISELIPEEIPHRFKTILAALAQKNLPIPLKKQKLKKYARLKPKSFSWILKSALMGKNIPVWRLRSVLYFRQVSFYREKSLVCREQDQYLNMVQGMAKLIQRIGFKGWIVLFDEGESIIQTRITLRSKSYELLHKIFFPLTKTCGFYPVFAFTNDFFTYVTDEEYDRTKEQKNSNKSNPVEITYFRRNYSEIWKNITIHRLQDLSSQEWKILIIKLIKLHAAAYRWKPSVDIVQNQIKQKLSKHPGAQTRLKLKFLVNLLDLEQQKQIMENHSSV